jgi:hypothetical protein
MKKIVDCSKKFKNIFLVDLENIVAFKKQTASSTNKNLKASSKKF